MATRNVALSPDGTRLVYVTVSSLRVRALGGEDIPLAASGLDPFFSPDGQWLAFFSAKGLQRLSVSGGATEPITPAFGTERTFGGTWGSDGTIVISLGGKLVRVNAKGGPMEPIAQPDAARGELRYAWPEFLPDGRSILFTVLGQGGAADARIAVFDLTTRQTTSVLQGGHAARFVRTGHILYASQGRLYAVPFDLSRRETRGVPVALDGINIAATVGGFNANFAVSDTGTLAYLPPTTRRIRTMTWVDREGREEAIPAPPMEYVYPRISPDGTRVALDVAGANRDIWVANLASGVVTKITQGPTEDLMPAWSPDSSRVFFASDREGGAFRVYSISADGAGAERQEFAGTGNYMPLSMPSPDQLITFASGGTTRGGDLALVTVGGSGQPPKVLEMDGQQGNAQVSPDGHWIAYQSGETGMEEVFVRSYPDVDRRREQISLGGGIQPLWGRAGSNELLYWDLKGTLKVVTVTTTGDFRVGTTRDVALAPGLDRPVVGSWAYAVSPLDGRLLMFKQAAGNEGPVPVKVVVNWREELQRLAPAN